MLLIPQLNRGGTATVYEAQDLKNGTKVAVKVIHQGTPKSDVDMLLARESNAQSLQHPGIVRLLNVFREGPQQRLCIVSELVNGQDLLDTINAHGGHLQEETGKAERFASRMFAPSLVQKREMLCNQHLS